MSSFTGRQFKGYGRIKRHLKKRKILFRCIIPLYNLTKLQGDILTLDCRWSARFFRISKGKNTQGFVSVFIVEEKTDRGRSATTVSATRKNINLSKNDFAGVRWRRRTSLTSFFLYIILLAQISSVHLFPPEFQKIPIQISKSASSLFHPLFI